MFLGLLLWMADAASVDAAHAAVGEARALSDPAVTLETTRYSPKAVVGAAWTLPLFGQSIPGIHAAKAEEQAALARCWSIRIVPPPCASTSPPSPPESETSPCAPRRVTSSCTTRPWPLLPRGVRPDTVYDQAATVGDAIGSVRDAILLGILLCVGVLGLMLRDGRAGLIAAATVPITLAIARRMVRLKDDRDRDCESVMEDVRGRVEEAVPEAPSKVLLPHLRQPVR